ARARPAAAARPCGRGRVTDNAAVVSMLLLRRTTRATAWAVLLVDLFVLVVWAASGGGPFWPGWGLLPARLPGPPGWWAGEAKSGFSRLAGQSVVVSLFLIGVWAAAGGGSFWPVWPIAALALALGLRYVARGAKSEARVEELTQSRAGAVEAAESQLRR